MNILLTGASGFIGRNYLLKSKFSHEANTCIYYQSNTFPKWSEEQKNNSITIQKIDLTSLQEIESVLGKDNSYDICVYLAANGDPGYSFEHPVEDLYKNTVALVNLCSCIHAKKFIYFSSGAVYEGINGYVNPDLKVSPKLPYAISKLSSENYLRYFQSVKKIEKISIIRFFGAYGPYEAGRKIFGKLVKQFGILRHPDFIIKGDGENLIDAIYIDDAVTAIDNLIQDPSPPEILDLSSGNPLTITELVTKSAKVFSISPIISHKGFVPEYIKFVSNDDTYRKRYGIISKISLDEGLRLFYQYLIDQT